MNTLFSFFLSMIIISGILSGTILGLYNYFLTGPVLDNSIAIENQNSKSSLFGVLYYICKGLKLAKISIAECILLSTIMCVVFFIIPFLKYPPNPPGGGDSETILERQLHFLILIVTSSSSAVALSYTYRKKSIIKSRSFIFYPVMGYAVIVATAFYILPEQHPETSLDNSLILQFRISSFIANVVFWLTNGTIFGILWTRATKERGKILQ